VSSSAHQWPLANKDYANTRVANGSAITSANVHMLRPEWTFAFPPEATFAFGAAAANPIIAEDRVYMQDLGSNVAALDLETGALLWERRRNVLNAGPNGVAVGWGKVFSLGSERSFAALDKQTGAEIWSKTLSTHPGEGIDIQPTVYDGTVYTSTVPVTIQGFLEGLDGYLPGSVGVIHALDEATGETKWSFNTVDSADLWGNPELNSGGGAWYTPAIDTERGVTYWGTGNPAPWPGTEDFPNGSSRPGPNLYTNSVVALDHRTGALKWYNQVAPHDLFDLDFQIPPILTTIDNNGRERDILIGAGKTGSVIAFDRDTGERVWSTEVGMHENDHLTSVPEGQEVRVFPGNLGGVETPMAMADGVVFVPIVNLPTFFTSSDTRWDGGFDNALTTGTGELSAIDIQTGEVLWNREFDSMVFGGATVVNDLVFTSTFDGMIYALNRATGEEVWSYQAAGGINLTPAVAGDRMIFPVGVPGSAPPHLLALRIVPECSTVLLSALAMAGLAAIRRPRTMTER
jgi:glucose dehydrogenase